MGFYLTVHQVDIVVWKILLIFAGGGGGTKLTGLKRFDRGQ